MTHDELLAKIQFSRNDFNYVTPHNALRAVVELHKSNYGLCKACTTLTVHVAYPCPTIQTIEKELG